MKFYCIVCSIFFLYWNPEKKQAVDISHHHDDHYYIRDIQTIDDILQKAENVILISIHHYFPFVIVNENDINRQ